MQTNRMNDGKCDPRGRFWAGTMGFNEGRGVGALYRLDPDFTVHHMLGNVSISNGLDWTADGRQMYYLDSPTRGVDVFDFDMQTGALGARHRLISLPPGEPGAPDGMTLDEEGALWVAVHGSGTVRRYSSDGLLDLVVRLPVSMVTSCAFGGPDLADLYITTMQYGMSADAKHDQPLAGALFHCRPGVRGLPAHPRNQSPDPPAFPAADRRAGH